VSYPFLTLKIVTTQKLYLKTDVTQLALSISIEFTLAPQNFKQEKQFFYNSVGGVIISA